MKDWLISILVIWSIFLVGVGWYLGVHATQNDLKNYMSQAIILERCIWNGDMYKVIKMLDEKNKK